MRPTVSTGDLALAAQPATGKTIAPYGRLLEGGERAYLGKRGRVLVTMDRHARAPRRVAHLQCYPEAKRAFVPSGSVASWVVVLEAGDSSERRPQAFLLPAGVGIVLNEGVWHAGPVPLDDTTACEMLETRGAADRFDHKSLRELVDLAAVRVLLPQDPGAPASPLDLTAPNAVLLDAALHGRLRLGCVVIEDVAASAPGQPVTAELARAVEGLRTMWGHAGDLGEIPGVGIGRDLYREFDLAAGEDVPRSEALVGAVLGGATPEPASALEAVRALCALRTRAPLSFYDVAAIGSQVVVRLGAPGETFAGDARGDEKLEGRPVLSSAGGAFGGLTGDGAAAEVNAETRTVLAVVTVPGRTEDAAIEALLDAVTKALTTHCGGRSVGRLIVG